VRVFEILKNAVKLLCLGEWREFVFRVRILLGQIDLRFSSQADLDLPADRCYDYADSGGLHLEKFSGTSRLARKMPSLILAPAKEGHCLPFPNTLSDGSRAAKYRPNWSKLPAGTWGS
jgi:hypothetical protein